jgi:CHAD domain-containing protein
VAKARDIPGLHGQLTYAEAARATVASRSEELFDLSADVLDTGDIERVHDMRVASRRLRAVLEIYAPCFPLKAHKKVLAEVKALADALGARRDPDVQLAALDRFVQAVGDAERPGIAVFQERLHTEQRVGNDTLAAALARAQRADLRGRLQALAAAATDGAGGRA